MDICVYWIIETLQFNKLFNGCLVKITDKLSRWYNIMSMSEAFGIYIYIAATLSFYVFLFFWTEET